MVLLANAKDLPNSLDVEALAFQLRKNIGNVVGQRFFLFRKSLDPLDVAFQLSGGMAAGSVNRLRLWLGFRSDRAAGTARKLEIIFIFNFRRMACHGSLPCPNQNGEDVLPKQASTEPTDDPVEDRPEELFNAHYEPPRTSTPKPPRNSRGGRNRDHEDDRRNDEITA